MTTDPSSKRRSVDIRYVTPIMIACALTWSIGSLTNFFVPSTEQRRLLHTSAHIIPTDDLPHPENTQRPEYRHVHFLDQDQVDLNDKFSATWLQPKEHFMKMDVNNIKTVEDGCFQAFRNDVSKVRMTLDWLDFSVEHMSKWWKVAKLFGDDAVPYNKAMTSFQAYTRRARTKMDVHELSPLKDTFAIIAFQQYTGRYKGDDLRALSLTVASLAATIASLVNVGIGRVVVAGFKDIDVDIVQETFRYLEESLMGDTITKNETKPVTRIGPMEVGYVQVRAAEVKSKFVDANIPRGALYAVQHAFKGDLDANRTQDVFGTVSDKSRWKYIMLTEPDTILQSKPWALPQLQRALDQGLVLSPHRLQPVPHESDMIGMQDERRFVKAEGNFSTVIDLDSLDGAVCCDEQKGDFKPWRDYFGSCGNVWWDCGFKREGNWSHSHLKPYSLIRLEQGTGIVNLGATAHGRRCFPKKEGVCVPLGDSSSSSVSLA